MFLQYFYRIYSTSVTVPYGTALSNIKNTNTLKSEFFFSPLHAGLHWKIHRYINRCCYYHCRMLNNNALRAALKFWSPDSIEYFINVTGVIVLQIMWHYLFFYRYFKRHLSVKRCVTWFAVACSELFLKNKRDGPHNGKFNEKCKGKCNVFF